MGGLGETKVNPDVVVAAVAAATVCDLFTIYESIPPLTVGPLTIVVPGLTPVPYTNIPGLTMPYILFKIMELLNMILPVVTLEFVNERVVPAIEATKTRAESGKPASVVTTPAEVILRMQLLFVSVTYKLLAESVVIPNGKLKRAAEPVPSKYPGTPGEPAKSVTFPVTSIFLMVWLERSTMYIFLVVSNVI